MTLSKLDTVRRRLEEVDWVEVEYRCYRMEKLGHCSVAVHGGHCLHCRHLRRRSG